MSIYTTTTTQTTHTLTRTSSIVCINEESQKQQTATQTCALFLYSFSVQQGDVFFNAVCRDEWSPAGGEKKGQTHFFVSVYRGAPGQGVKYQKNPSSTEEALSRQHLILVLHDPLPVDVTSWTWSLSCKCIISDRESWIMSGFWSSGQKVLKELNYFSVPLRLLDKPK